jgi:hypothetical protein
MSGNSNDRWRRCDKLFAADGKLVPTYTFCSERSSIHLISVVFTRVGETARKDYYLRHACPSVRPPAWNSAANGRILMKFDISVFFENLLKKSKFRSNIQEKRVLYMKAYGHLWYLAEFFLEWEIFKTKVVEKIKTHILFFNNFFSRTFFRLCRGFGVRV